MHPEEHAAPAKSDPQLAGQETIGARIASLPIRIWRATFP